MSANSICQKVQLSAKAMLTPNADAGDLDLVPSQHITAGIATGSMALPRVVCVCKRAIAEEIFDGNWTADLTVRVEANATDTDETAFHAMAGQVFGLFFQASETVAAALSNATVEFTAFAVYPRTQEWDILEGENGNGSGWVSELVVTVKCCGSTIG